MSVIKCKMCGGDLNITTGVAVAVCDYCGSKQTIPNLDNDKKEALFTRANRLRFNCEFDRAAGIYESIVSEFSKEAEAYWGLLLCKYGIEYVDDVKTGRKVPTCHRSAYESIFDDDNFAMVMENCDVLSQEIYREEAKIIENLRKNIIEVSNKEEPYDIFISYKETDDNGNRTLDSVLAQDIYDALTEKGYRVFFSRITLEDKLGQEYEPYIFSALNTAKVMLVVGTDYENFNAVWVKNEWNRFLSLISKGKEKILIPCYKNIDAYDIPQEFQRLQAQDMGKIGAIQDLLRGIDKLFSQNSQENRLIENNEINEYMLDAEKMKKRGYMSLEDGEWDSAVDFFEKALNLYPEYAEAYLGLAMEELKTHTFEEFKQCIIEKGSLNCKNMKWAQKYAKGKLKEQLDYIEGEMRNKNESVVRKRYNNMKKTAGKLACSGIHIVGVMSNGKVVASLTSTTDKGQCNVSNWRDIVSVAAGGWHTLGLKRDGTVVAAGDNQKGQCNVLEWKEIMQISAGGGYSVGLKNDGTVVATGDNQYGQCNVLEWKSITEIAATSIHTVGLRHDGTVIATGSNDKSQCDVSKWEKIICVGAGAFHTVGLKVDGTVVAAGDNQKGQCDVSDWKDIIYISVGAYDTVGIKSDGSVIATGMLSNFKKDTIRKWKYLVNIVVGANDIVGLKIDGTVVATEIQSKVKTWKLFNNVKTIEKEYREAKAKEENNRKIMDKLLEERNALEQELSELKGFFSKKRQKEIAEKLIGIDKEVSKLQ